MKKSIEDCGTRYSGPTSAAALALCLMGCSEAPQGSELAPPLGLPTISLDPSASSAADVTTVTPGGSPSTSSTPSAPLPGTGGGANVPAASGTQSPDGTVGGAAPLGDTGVGGGGPNDVPIPLIDDGLPGRALIRRLSNEEYTATVGTLFGDLLAADALDVSANFPEETVVNGFTNNTDVQDVGPALAEQYLVSAENIAAVVAQDLDSLLGCPLADGETCVGDFIGRFGKRAWRRPLSADEQASLLLLFGSESDPAIGVRLLVQGFLTSPNFLYRVEMGVPVSGEPYAALNSWELASRLSYFLTGTMPDEGLLAAAEADRLTTASDIEAEARRLLATPEARENVAAFFSGWLNLHAVDRLQRESDDFPAWNSQLPPLFYAETRAFATSVVFDGAGDLTTLLTATFTYGDPSLAEYYGGTAAPAVDGISRIDLPAGQRSGLLTQASFLATHAKEIQTDPVQRGKFVRERMLCQGIPAPPPDLMVKAPTITPGSTTRQRFVQHEEDPTCATCHVLIDPIGLAFENYDAIGQWRDQEQGVDIDASGDLTATDVSGPFVGVVEMTTKLAESELVAECFVRYWFRFAFGRGESDSEAARMATITSGFEANDQRVQELLIGLTSTPDFRFLLAEGTTQ